MHEAERLRRRRDSGSHPRTGALHAGGSIGSQAIHWLGTGTFRWHPPSVRILVHIPSQTLDLLDDAGKLLRRYACSTSKFGPGFEPGSNKTPTGRFRIAEKHGHNAEAGMIFRSRKATGEFGSAKDDADHVQTRILWLDGVDPENANTKDRYIYIHGTNAEDHLGTPASHGCVRLSDTDVVDLFDLVPEGAEVAIDPGD